MIRKRIAYYAHDSGSGHLRHAENVARHPHFDVLLITAGPVPSDGPWHDVVQLTADLVPGYEQPINAPFHYIPTAPNIRQRFAQIHNALMAFEPDVVMVDVSAEVAAFAKLAGYPVLVRRMHGQRTDRAHQNLYDLADGLFAYYPETIESADTQQALVQRTSYVGMLELPRVDHIAVQPHRVVVQTSLGGNGVDLQDIDHAAVSTPEWEWMVAGASTATSQQPNVKVLGHVTDVRELLASAAVIVTSTGHNAVRAAVAARRPLVLVPEPRMYDEQQQFAQAIAEKFDTPLVTEVAAADWPALLDGIRAQDHQRLADALLVSPDQFYGALSRLVGSVTQ